jgi:hypothetical protein
MRGYEHLMRCRVCQCTEMEACYPPCSWEPGEAELCSNCAEAIRAVRRWLSGGLRPSWAALRREALKVNNPGPGKTTRRATRAAA